MRWSAPSVALAMARCRRGTAATELALVLPVAMLLVAGIVEIGGLVEVMSAVNQMATQYALAWADCSDTPAGTCGTELTYYGGLATTANVEPQLTASTLTLQMFEVTMSGTTPTVVYSYPAAASLTAAQTASAQAAFSNGQTGVLVTTAYTHSLRFFSTLMTPYLGNLLTVTYTVTQLKS
jgi:Flp pilus assembly protein TadG